MLVLREVEKICRRELTLSARLGRQDKSTGAKARPSRCLHIQDLSLAVRAMSLKHGQALCFADEERLHRDPACF
jgi:hypothetical protein